MLPVQLSSALLDSRDLQVADLLILFCSFFVFVCLQCWGGVWLN